MSFPPPDDIDRIMAIMAAAFDPHYGEAWTRRQVEEMVARTEATIGSLGLAYRTLEICTGGRSAASTFLLQIRRVRNSLNLDRFFVFI